MADLRDMQLLVALSRHQHFARAADECGISQPAFSGRIRNMESSFGVPLVKRGNRFLGFTAEGDIVLKWASKMLADAKGMRQEIDLMKGALTGKLSIGAVPTALTFAADVPAALRNLHPELSLEIVSASSSDIRRGLEDFSLDAGVTYLDEDGITNSFRTDPLYEERYVLLVPAAMAPRLEGAATWREAAGLPLCLLTRNMNNRRIIDDVFLQIGAAPVPVMETNAFTAAFAQVASGAAATIAPERLATSLPIAKGAIRLALEEPLVERRIGLVMVERDPMPPAMAVLKTALMTLL